MGRSNPASTSESRSKGPEPAPSSGLALEYFKAAHLKRGFYLAPGHKHHRVAHVFVEEGQTLHHPGIKPVVRVLGHLAHDVKPVLEPTQLVAGRRRKDGDLAILTLVAVLRYVLAIVSETSCSVVW